MLTTDNLGTEPADLETFQPWLEHQGAGLLLLICEGNIHLSLLRPPTFRYQLQRKEPAQLEQAALVNPFQHCDVSKQVIPMAG